MADEYESLVLLMSMGPGDEGDVTEGDVTEDGDVLVDEVYRDEVVEWRGALTAWIRRQVPDIRVWRSQVLMGALAALVVLLVSTALWYLLGLLQGDSGVAGTVSPSPRVPRVGALLACWLGTYLGAGVAPPRWGRVAAFRFGSAAVLPVALTAGLTAAFEANSAAPPGVLVAMVVVGITGSALAWGFSRWSGTVPVLLAVAISSVGAKVAAWAWLGDLTLKSLSDDWWRAVGVVVPAVAYLVAVALGVVVLCRRARETRALDAVAVGVVPALVNWVVPLLGTLVWAHSWVPAVSGYVLLNTASHGVLGGGTGALVAWFLRDRRSQAST